MLAYSPHCIRAQASILGTCRLVRPGSPNEQTTNYSLFAPRMEVYTLDLPIDLVEADVIKPLETRARDRLDAVVGHEKVLLPPHPEVLSLRVVLVRKARAFCCFRQRPPLLEPVPVLHVDFLVGAPFGMLGLEGVLCADDFAFEVGREGWMIFC
jgi:hypothetical protein